MRTLLPRGFTCGTLLSVAALPAFLDSAGELQRDPATALSYCRLAHTYYRAREHAKALDQLQSALTYDPHNPRILHAAGVVLFALQRYDEASAHFLRVFKNAAAPVALREKAENGLAIIERIEDSRRKKRMGRVVSWGFIALIAVTVPLAIRTFARFFRLSARTRRTRIRQKMMP